MTPSRRSLLTAVIASPFLSAPFIRPARADGKVVRMGSLKLIHSITPYFYEKFAPAGTTIEVIPFESPTECARTPS